MFRKAVNAVKRFVVEVIKLFVEGIAELHISGGKVAFNVDLSRLVPCC